MLADAKSAAPAELAALLHESKKTNVALGNGKIGEVFIEGYREFISLQNARDSYRTFFTLLADNQKLPAVFHCTTGKDRTGWASAALLTLLGVPRETVMADFLRSNKYTLPQFKNAIDSFAAAGGDRDIPTAIFGVKAEYLNASFDEMEKQYGTIENYFAAWTSWWLFPTPSKSLSAPKRLSIVSGASIPGVREKSNWWNELNRL